ncbi:MAG: cytotoxin, partial [Nitrospinota bacterium]
YAQTPSKMIIKKLPKAIQERFDKKILLFEKNLRHSSLRVKKMKGHKNRWEASIDMFYRFTFEIHEDYFLLRRIGPHDNILKKP